MTTTRLAAAVALLFLATPAAAGEGDVQVTLAAGAMLPGSIYVEPYNWDTGSGLALNAGVDYFVSNRLSAGLILQYSSTTLTEVDVGVSTIGVGGSLKVLIGNAQAFHAKVGATISYQMNSSDQPSADDSKGFGLGALFEAIYPVSPKLGLEGQVGFVSQPSGGNASAEVSWSPLFFVGAGVVFGL